MDSVKEFISEDHGSGFGYGFGSGYGSGFGYGYGSGYDSGNGDGDGDGNGDGDGYGSGYGSGFGYGYGSGNGSGYDSGNGDGNGDGSGIKSFRGDAVYIIDGRQTILKHIYGNIARGYILGSDLTLTNCYVVKGQGYFAHGKTLRDALEALENKILKDSPIEDRIERFLEEFNLEDKYPAKELFDWHGRLTGSCKAGRMAFVRDHDIDLDRDTFTVREMIDLCRNDYGSEVIQKLEEAINGNTR